MSRAGFGKGYNLKPSFAIQGQPGNITSSSANALTLADSQPVSTKVLIENTVTGQVVAEVISSSLGAWEIRGLRLGIFYSARIKDNTRALNGAVVDWLEAKV